MSGLNLMVEKAHIPTQPNGVGGDNLYEGKPEGFTVGVSGIATGALVGRGKGVGGSHLAEPKSFSCPM